MSYLVLARKYRPRNFGALVGQEHVVQALANALTQQRLHHAYLFTGTRGVGKTTVSRILAKALNCTGPDGQGGITAQPCGVCEACRDIDSGRFVDYVELDAASNRGVEEISQLLDQSVYKPVVGRFKVYMIDEVHMLSNTAFNAMLKTLEEPPEYLKFVLATTDPQKVPPTVLSRCLQFNLRPMAAATVQAHLAEVLAAEAVPADAGALRLLSRAARGSMRDALSLTDQAIAFGSGALQEDSVRQMLGAVDRRHASRLLECLAAGDGAGLVETADALRAMGLSATGTLEEMSELLQHAAVIQVVPDAIDPTEPEPAALRRVAALFAADTLQLLYSICLHGRAELALAPDEHSGLVMVLLRMLAFRPGESAAVRPPAQAPMPAVAPIPAATPAPARIAVPVAVGVAAPREALAEAAVRTRAPWDDEPTDALASAAPTGGGSVPVTQDAALAPATPGGVSASDVAPAPESTTPAPAPAPRAAPLLASRPAQASVALPEAERHERRGNADEAGSEATTKPPYEPGPDAPAAEAPGSAGDEPPPWLDVPDEPGLSRSRGSAGAPRASDSAPSDDGASGGARLRASLHAQRPSLGQQDATSPRLSARPVPQGIAAAPDAAPAVVAGHAEPTASALPAETVEVEALPGSPECDRWNAVVVEMVAAGQISALVRELAMQAECLQVDEAAVPMQWRLRVERESLRSPAQCEKLQKALAEHLAAAVALQIEPGVARDSPARRAVAERDRRQREAERVIAADPLVQQLMRDFRTARIVPGSIQPR